MALKVEGIMDGGMHAEKTLGGSSRFEPLHFALSSSHRLMRILGPIVLMFLVPVFDTGKHRSLRRTITPQLVRHDQTRT